MCLLFHKIPKVQKEPKDWLKCFKFGYNIPQAWKDIPGMMHVNE